MTRHDLDTFIYQYRGSIHMHIPFPSRPYLPTVGCKAVQHCIPLTLLSLLRVAERDPWAWKPRCSASAPTIYIGLYSTGIRVHTRCQKDKVEQEITLPKFLFFICGCYYHRLYSDWCYYHDCYYHSYSSSLHLITIIIHIIIIITITS